MKIRFIKAYKVPGADGRAFAEGDTIGMPDESAQHYIDCGAAEAANQTEPRDARKRATTSN